MVKCLLWTFVIAYLIGIWWLSSRGAEITAKVDAAGISDLNAHLMLFGGLSFLIRLALQATWPHQPGCLLATVATLATFTYGLIDEWHQSFVPGRGFDAQDLWGDLAGALAGQFLAAFIIILGGRLHS